MLVVGLMMTMRMKKFWSQWLIGSRNSAKLHHDEVSGLCNTRLTSPTPVAAAAAAAAAATPTTHYPSPL